MESISIVESFYDNIREISKREKLFGLNHKSWIFISFPSMIIMTYISFLIALSVFAFLALIFYVAEFFDDDITDILLARLVLSSRTDIFYA